MRLSWWQLPLQTNKNWKSRILMLSIIKPAIQLGALIAKLIACYVLKFIPVETYGQRESVA